MILSIIRVHHDGIPGVSVEQRDRAAQVDPLAVTVCKRKRTRMCASVRGEGGTRRAPADEGARHALPPCHAGGIKLFRKGPGGAGLEIRRLFGFDPVVAHNRIERTFQSGERGLPMLVSHLRKHG